MKNKHNKNAAIIVHSGDFDKIMSAFIIGNGFLSMGVDVTLFFTFWGLQALTKGGFKKAPLSKMNFFSLGRLMINSKMRKYNVAGLERLTDSFKKLGGKIIACTMTMELMGIKKESLRDDLISDYAAVGAYCYQSLHSEIQLFI